MTIKGKTLEARAPFTLKQEKGVLILDGTFPLKRLDYDIGSGVWSDTSVVADEVLVKFHFVLK
jgi:polyisoprenoid-binding protein YceI